MDVKNWSNLTLARHMGYLVNIKINPMHYREEWQLKGGGSEPEVSQEFISRGRCLYRQEPYQVTEEEPYCEECRVRIAKNYVVATPQNLA